MTNPPVPATPLDVEACVRLLDDLILMLAPHDAQSIADANQLRALASALPGIGKDSERLDWLEHAVPSGEFRDACNALPNKWPGTFREFIDAARAAQPEETSDG